MKPKARQSEPLYSVIEAALRGQIASGAQPVGSCLPTEHELSAQFGASRFTIRQALTGLRAAGMIEPRPGIGTLVIAASPRTALVQTLRSVDELFQYPGPMLREHQATSRIRADAALAELMGGEPGDEWLRMEATRRSEGAELPLCWMEAFLSPQHEEVARLASQEGTPFLTIFERVFGLKVAQAQIHMTAGQVAPEMAAPLLADPGTPALIITRRYRDDSGAIFLTTRLVHPEGRFSLNFEFQTP